MSVQEDIRNTLASERTAPDSTGQPMYDIYLYMGCQTPPDLHELVAEAPALAAPEVQQKIMQRSPAPGWLHVDLPYPVARHLFQQLKSAKATGLLARAAYHQPQVTSQEAEQRAHPALQQKQAALYPNYTFESTIYLTRDQPTCWEFTGYSEELVRKGHIPGGVSVCVDKLDGHIWQAEEFDRLRGE